MKCWLLAPLILTGLLAARPVSADDDSPPPGFDPQRHMRVSEVKEGMKGYGLSVFKGTKIERFDVEVVSVLRNFNPRHDVILVQLKGANLEHTGPVAGMSGSPIFLKDEQGRERMVGAFAYGWQLVKDPIGGVQPIEYMLRLPATPGKTPAGTPVQPPDNPAGKPQMTWSLDEVVAVPWKEQPPRGYPLAGWNNPRPNPLLGIGSDAEKLVPLATPMMMSGLSQRMYEKFDPILRAYGLAPLQAGAASAPLQVAAVKLEPGSSLAVPMMTGDTDMTAIGTCTEIVGDRVLGFGHAFFSEGNVSLPMSTGYVHGVIANLSSSFKLGSALQTQGTLLSDQLTGIAGRLGSSPKTVPMEVRCVYTDGSMDQTYRFQAAQHKRFMPILASMAVSSATTSSRDLPQYYTLDYDLTLQFANGQTLHVQNRMADDNVAELFRSIGGPIMAAAENPFEQVSLQQLTGTVRVSNEPKQAEILSVSMPRSKYRPGETVKASVRYRPFRAPELILPLEFELPRDLPNGAYDFAVTDWREYLSQEQASRPFRFTAQSAKDVFDVLRDLASVRQDAVYMRLIRQPDGVAIGRTALPRLPSSRRRVLLGAGRSNTSPFVSSTVKSVASEYVISGSAQFSITIDKDLKVETAPKPGKPESPDTTGETKKINDGK
jgi:hypothetical protein